MKPDPDCPERGAARWGAWPLTGGLTAALLIGYFTLPMTGRWWLLPAVAGPAAIGALMPLTLRHTRSILVSDQPLQHATQAILLMLVLLVLGFAATYYTLEAHWPEEFAGLETKTDAVYFTVTILATVGFGDIQPTGQLARAVATFHMLANLVVVTVSLRLVIDAGRRRLKATETTRPG